MHESSGPRSRREFLSAIGGGALAAAWLAADPRELLAAIAYARGLGAETPPAFQVLTAQQGADFEAVTALIIPSDETPGAREARVVYFIDRALATFARAERAAMVEGWRELTRRAAAAASGARSFAALSEAKQTAVLASLEKDHHPFFEGMLGATIAGMFASPEYGGNHDRIGWKLIGFEDQFSWAPPFGWYDRVDAR